MLNDPTSIEKYVSWFNLIGWIALIIVLVFNLSILVGAFI